MTKELIEKLKELSLNEPDDSDYALKAWHYDGFCMIYHDSNIFREKEKGEEK